MWNNCSRSLDRLSESTTLTLPSFRLWYYKFHVVILTQFAFEYAETVAIQHTQSAQWMISTILLHQCTLGQPTWDGYHSMKEGWSKSIKHNIFHFGE
jgi:hypothetical protein